MASVVIVDDAELFREALRAAFVQEGFEVKAVAADAMHAIDMAREHQPDLVMLDLLMPGMSGVEVVGAIIKSSPTTRVVLLTSSESAKDLLAAVKAGASGYLTKDTPLPRLVAAMHDVLEGGAAVSPAMGETVQCSPRPAAPPWRSRGPQSRADGARARDPGLCERRQDLEGDRGRAIHLREHRSEPCAKRSRQAGSQIPIRSSHLGAAGRAHRRSLTGPRQHSGSGSTRGPPVA